MHERIGVGTEHAAGHRAAADVFTSCGGFQETRCRTGERRFVLGESRLVPSDTAWYRLVGATAGAVGAGRDVLRALLPAPSGSSARVTPNGLWDRLRVGHEHGHDGHRSDHTRRSDATCRTLGQRPGRLRERPSVARTDVPPMLGSDFGRPYGRSG